MGRGSGMSGGRAGGVRTGGGGAKGQLDANLVQQLRRPVLPAVVVPLEYQRLWKQNLEANYLWSVAQISSTSSRPGAR